MNENDQTDLLSICWTQEHGCFAAGGHKSVVWTPDRIETKYLKRMHGR